MQIERTSAPDLVLTEMGERISRLRIDQNLTQAELADRAGIGLRTLQRLESGAAASQLSSLIKVCQALGLEQRLDALFPKPEVSPIALMKLQEGGRQRASGKQAAAKNEPWSWAE